MQAVKVGWAGQTFALAKCSDSRGKKPRSRKSKEERRSMVESFIKKYRKSNDGNFPSLNLTHKEVGGSFYTVREIVREIIQDNKVLGPADFPLEEQHTAGTGTEEHQSHLLSMSSVIENTVGHKQPEIVFLSKEDEGKPEELGTTLGEGTFNESYEIVESKDYETVKSYHKDLSVPQFIHKEVVAYQHQNMYSNGDLVGENLVEEEGRMPSKTEQIEKKNDRIDYKDKEVSSEKMDVMDHALELPVDAVASTLYNSEDVVSGNKEEYSISKTEHPPDFVCKSSTDKFHDIAKTSDSIDLQKNSVAVDAVASELVVPDDTPETKIMTDSETQNGYVQTQEESSPAFVGGPFSSASSSNLTYSQNGVSEVAETSVTNPSSEGSNFHRSHTSLTSGVTVPEVNSTLKDAVVELSQNDSVILQSCNHPNLVTNLEPVLVPSDAQVQNTSSIGKTPGESTDSTTAAEIAGEADLKFNRCIKNETSNEISSHSLAEEDKKSVETNPFWVAIKAFIDAFVKFWVE